MGSRVYPCFIHEGSVVAHIYNFRGDVVSQSLRTPAIEEDAILTALNFIGLTIVFLM